MNNRRNFVLGLLVGIVLMAFAALSIAQTTNQQGDQKKQVENCCATKSCCCHSGSCAKKTGEQSEIAASKCCGDSCKMGMKHDAKNHASEVGCCSSKSCEMKAQHDANNQSAQPGCCAGHLQTGMKAKHDTSTLKHDVKNHDMKNGCCCCGDTCEMKPRQTGF